jgi:lipopolysaccharide/colanic/teichoic acid biosynthesis glycosyltransferase
VTAAYGAALAHANLPGEAGAVHRLLLRSVEVAIALAALVLTAPVMLLVMIAVRLDSPGPAVFRQRRVGRDLKPFTLYKLRTLFVDAKERFPELYAYDVSPDEVRTLTLSDLKSPDDPRVTRLGRWLRATSLDEIPNFINVLRGDVALVGPRPEIFECLRYYQGEQLIKFTVRPGVTGLAQVSGRNQNSFHEMIRWDVAYVRQRSILLDLRIVLRTFDAVLSRKGAW